jgi:cyclase
VVAAVDIKYVNDQYKVFIHGGKLETEREGYQWCKETVERGAGEILLTSMDRDGTKDGYELEFLNNLTRMVSVPVIASGGAGCRKHFSDAFKNANVDACLAASLFHYKELEIVELKKYLKSNGVIVRL